MGKGKKKDKKKEEPPNLEALSISEASTVQASGSSQSTSEPEASKPEPAKTTPTQPEPAKDDDDGGLGLGGGGKKRPKKKKAAVQGAAQGAAASGPAPVGGAVQTPVWGQGPPGLAAGDPAPASWGKPGVQTGPPGLAAGPPGFTTGPPGMPTGPPGFYAGPPGMPASQPGLPRPAQTWTQIPQEPGPTTLPYSLSASPPTPSHHATPLCQTGLPTSLSTSDTSSGAGRGRGRGHGHGQPQSEHQTKVALVPYSLSASPPTPSHHATPLCQTGLSTSLSTSDTSSGAGRGRGRGRGHGQPQSEHQTKVALVPPGLTTAPPSFFAKPTPSPLSQTGQPSSSAGRGRGQPQRQQHTEGIPPQSQAQASSQGPPPAQQQLARKPVSAGSGSGQLCRYTVPLKIPTRTVQGVRDIKLITNYLPMSITPNTIYRYDVAISPDKPKKMIPKVFALFKQKLFPKCLVAFDQMKNLYAYQPLPKVNKDERVSAPVEIVDGNGKTMKFEVSVKSTGTVELSSLLTYMKNGTSLNPPTEAIHCIDVILRQGTLESYIKAGRQFFKRPAKPLDLGDGLEMWTGLFQSAIFTSAAYINIDVAHKGFPRNQPLLAAYQNDFGLNTSKTLDQQYGRGVENFEDFIKGLRVVAAIGGDSSTSGMKREFICNGLVQSANALKFTMTDAAGKKTSMTVAEYFSREKRIRLQYPNMSCVWVGPRDKSIYYPMELLTVSYGQARNKQLNEKQLSTMVREAATPPDERKRKIDEVIKDMNYSSNPNFKQFGLKIDTNFLSVNAKVLQAPILEVGGRETVQPRRGAWLANKVYRPEPLSAWGFLAIEVDARSNVNYDNIISLIMKCGQQMGMEVARPQLTDFNVKMNFLQKYLLTALEKNIKFLFIVVPTRGKDYYHKVKRMAERDVGILTQCIKEFTAARKINPQTVKNILLKVNSKLMGINQVLDGRCLPKCIKDGGVMVVGADVTHPSPDQTSVPSIAAVTASIDPKCFQYNIALSIQTPKLEMIAQFEEMMVEHLQIYYKHQGSYPRKIYVFRDGVSEGQFAQVMNSELTAVYNAHYRMTNSPKKPEVLFLLVQKRHHTRFFLGDRNPQNVEPGTVVDTQIVHAKELDFYLVSHAAIKGTARPTRYHAVCNDGRIPDDEVEQLTYYLCHLYSRCMRAVSYPTPTYYAHLACFRARSLTHGEKFDNQELEKNPRRLRVMEKMLQFSRMFFV